jgi:hypothetical protein
MLRSELMFSYFQHWAMNIIHKFLNRIHLTGEVHAAAASPTSKYSTLPNSVCGWARPTLVLDIMLK